MTVESFLGAYGPIAASDTLLAPKARNFARDVIACPKLGVSVVEARETDGISTVVIDVALSIGQKPRNDIRERERLLVAFDASDRRWPAVYSLRADFPKTVPHLNVAALGMPPSLCLSDRPYEEVKRDWSAAYYVALIRNWLERTAKGGLHALEQSLEPFLLHALGTLVVPHRLFEAPFGDDERWVVQDVNEATYRLVRDDGDQLDRRRVALILAKGPPREHGGIPAVPNTLAELAKLVDRDDFSLLQVVKEQVLRWRHEGTMLEALPILVLQVPLARFEGGPAEQYDIHAFFVLHGTVHSLGVALDLWDRYTPKAAVLFPDPSRDGSDVNVGVLSVHKTLSRSYAAAYNGEPLRALKYAAVGVGALGSQLLMNLARGGHKPLAVVDRDHLLPHNLARHLLLDDSICMRKAQAVAAALDRVVDERVTVRAIFADLLDDDGLTAVVEDLDVILDLSASVAVARRLAIDTKGAARRISVFLTPSGRDLVLLSEDLARIARLDHLEIQYYWSVAIDGFLQGHLDTRPGIRYGGNCRDVSGCIRQTSLAVHAGNGAAAFHLATSQSEASAFVWKLDEATGVITRTELDVRPMRTVTAGSWTIHLSEALLDELARARNAKLPNETGGALIGALDMERQLAYLVGNIPAPPDSKEWPTGYIRGSYGLRRSVAFVTESTASNLQYVGEWHSHPTSATTELSKDDRIAYAWLTEALADEGRPAIMLVVGDREVRCILQVAEAILAAAA